MDKTTQHTYLLKTKELMELLRPLIGDDKLESISTYDDGYYRICTRSK